MLIILSAVLLAPASSRAAEPKADRLSLSNLSLEVAALQTLQRFQMTATQMEALRKLAPDTVQTAKRQAGKASDKYRQTLVDLRAALLRGDEDRVEQLEDRLAEIDDAEEAELDDEIEITATARRRASEVLLTLSPRQVAAFLSDPPEPMERMMLAFDAVGRLKDDDWKDFSEDLVGELSWQLGGLDPDRSRMVADKVAQFLGMLRSMKKDELKKQRPDLEKAARQFVGSVPPTVVLHNAAEHALAELLSNPRLSSAIEARLKK
jgi:hypothetical protein